MPPPLSPRQKKYVLLISIIIDYYWNSSCLSHSNVICSLPHFGYWIKHITGYQWCGNFRVNYRSIPSRFFLSITTVSIFVFDRANHTREKMKSSSVEWISFQAQIAYCLKTEALVVPSISSISWSKSNRSKRDEYWSLSFPIKQSKMFHFWMLKSIICKKSVTCQTEMRPFSFF